MKEKKYHPERDFLRYNPTIVYLLCIMPIFRVSISVSKMSSYDDDFFEEFPIDLFQFLQQTNDEIIEFLKRVNGSGSNEVKLFYELRRKYNDPPCPLKIEIEEACYRECLPSVMFMTVRKENDIAIRDNLLYAARIGIAQLNAEYEYCKYRQYSQEFEKGLEGEIHGGEIPTRCLEMRKMMRLILDTWTNVRHRLQEQRLAKGTPTVVRNRMVVNKKQKNDSEYLSRMDVHYNEINFAQLGLAAFNLNDYPRAVFYLEDCLQRNVTYTAGGRHNEFDADLDFPDLNITRQQVLDLLACSYFHLNHHDQVAGLLKRGSALSLVEESEIFNRLRSNTDWHQMIDLCRQLTDVYSDKGIEKNFHDKAVESAIELGKWDEAEELHERFITDNECQKPMGFDFYFNNLLFGLRGLLKIHDEDARDRKRKILIDQVAQAHVPPLLSSKTINRHRNENGVQICLLNNIEILLKWLKAPENREELEETVYAEWREKRLLFPLKEQDYMIEKECAILNLLTESELLMLDEHRGLKTLSSSLLSMAHLKRSSICATMGDSARASDQIQKARKYADDDTYEWDISLQEAKQCHLFGSSAIGHAYDQLVRLCSDQKLISKRITNERFRMKERLTLYVCLIPVVD